MIQKQSPPQPLQGMADTMAEPRSHQGRAFSHHPSGRRDVHHPFYSFILFFFFGLLSFASCFKRRTGSLQPPQGAYNCCDSQGCEVQPLLGLFLHFFFFAVFYPLLPAMLGPPAMLPSPLPLPPSTYHVLITTRRGRESECNSARLQMNVHASPWGCEPVCQRARQDAR